MAAETKADPTARDLLRVAVDYAERARAAGESFDGPPDARRERFVSLLRVADTYSGLARTAGLIESTEPEIRADDEWPESVQCQTCGHLQGLHLRQTGCLACNRRGGLCEIPRVVMCPGRGACVSYDRDEGHKHMSDGQVLPVESGSLVDLDALRRSVTGESAGTVNVRPLRPTNRGPFGDDNPTQIMPVVRREQVGPFGPPDVDATAAIPRADFSVKCNGVDVSSGRRCQRERHDDNRHDFPSRCKVTNLGRRCLLDAGHDEGTDPKDHAFAPLVPAGPDRFA